MNPNSLNHLSPAFADVSKLLGSEFKTLNPLFVSSDPFRTSHWWRTCAKTLMASVQVTCGFLCSSCDNFNEDIIRFPKLTLPRGWKGNLGKVLCTHKYVYIKRFHPDKVSRDILYLFCRMNLPKLLIFR
jgi:hypothetical protein